VRNRGKGREGKSRKEKEAEIQGGGETEEERERGKSRLINSMFRTAESHIAPLYSIAESKCMTFMI
jgi:hypothetical protein